ncbi:MAG TPA: hypothetical protein VIN56_04400 [Candidatus Dormibacteraeota bacterium]
MARLPEPQVLGADGNAEPQPHPLTIGFVSSGRAASTLAHSLGDVTFLAVPDGAVAEVATQLAEDTPDGRGRLVAHLSGSQGRDVLEALVARGYATAAITRSRSSRAGAWRLAPGTAFAVEAEGPARDAASRSSSGTSRPSPMTPNCGGPTRPARCLPCARHGGGCSTSWRRRCEHHHP